MWFTLLSGSLRLRDWLAESSSNSFVSIPSESSYSKNKKKGALSTDSVLRMIQHRALLFNWTNHQSAVDEFAIGVCGIGIRQRRTAPVGSTVRVLVQLYPLYRMAQPKQKKNQEKIKTRFDTMMKWWSDIVDIELVEWNDVQQLMLPGRHAAEVVEQLGSSLLVLQLLLVFLQRQRDPLHSVHLHGAAERRRRRRYPRRGRRRAAAVAIAVAATAAGAAAWCRSASSGRTGGMRPARRVNTRNWNVRWICLHPHYNSK